MTDKNILILCTGNSARSIIGEVLASSMPGLKGYSAGSTPRGEVHPMALTVLEAKGHDIVVFSNRSIRIHQPPQTGKEEILIF